MDRLIGQFKHFVRWFFNVSPTWHDRDSEAQNSVKNRAPRRETTAFRTPNPRPRSRP